MPKLDLDAIEQVTRTGYPSPYREAMTGRHYRRLSPAGGLARIGASHVVLAGRPGDNEAALREAGIDDFVFAGCDALAALQRAHAKL